MEILANGTKVKVYDLLGEFVEGTIQGNDEAECEGNLKDLNYYVVVDGNFDNEIMMHWSEIELIWLSYQIRIVWDKMVWYP